MWLGFWLIGLSAVALLGWIPLAQIQYEHGLGPAGLVAGALGLVVLWALRPRWWFVRTPQSDFQPLAPDRFPALFEFVEEIARRAGVSAPDQIYLVGGATASTYIERRWLRRRRVLNLGLPLFGELSRAELGSVVAHEFGHHAGGDLGLGPWVYRTRVAIASAVDNLEDSAFLLDLPFRAYGNLFMRVSSSVSRRQELAADALAARLCGTAAAAAALDRIHRFAPLWDSYFDLEVLPVIALGVRIPLFDGFRRFVAASDRRAGVARQIVEREERPPSPWDSHPPLEDRLASLGAPAPAVPPTHCFELLGGEAEAERAWYEVATWGELQGSTWDEVGAQFVLPSLEKQFSELAIALELQDLPRLIAEGGELWDRLRGDGVSLFSPEAKRKRAQALLVEWLAVVLFQRGFAPVVRPGANLLLRSADATVCPAAIVEGLASGELSAESYRSMAELWRVPLPP